MSTYNHQTYPSLSSADVHRNTASKAELQRLFDHWTAEIGPAGIQEWKLAAARKAGMVDLSMLSRADRKRAMEDAMPPSVKRRMQDFPDVQSLDQAPLAFDDRFGAWDEQEDADFASELVTATAPKTQLADTLSDTDDKPVRPQRLSWTDVILCSKDEQESYGQVFSRYEASTQRTSGEITRTT